LVEKSAWTVLKLDVDLSIIILLFKQIYAEVAELADALDSKSSVLKRRVGSTPTFGTIINGYQGLQGF
jgi:hypothetical protein